MSSLKVFPEEKWRELGLRMLTASGMIDADARTVTDVLITGSLRGIDSHGVRLLPYFTRDRKITPMRILKETKGTALLDAGNNWGPVCGVRMMEIAIEKAEATGIGCCNVSRGDWITNLFYYPMMAVKRDMIGMVFASGSSITAPWGGTKPVTGTNPMSIGIPAGKSYPIVLDFATTAVAQGHVQTYVLEQKPIPEGWLIDRQGNPVTGNVLTPETLGEFWKTGGSLLPFGTYKGYGLNVAIDLLAGGLIPSWRETREQGQGLISIALDIKAFLPVEEFKDEVERLIADIKSSPVRPGFKEVLLPGEMESRTMEKRKREGIPIHDKPLEDVRKTCSRLKVDVDSILS